MVHSQVAVSDEGEPAPVMVELIDSAQSPPVPPQATQPTVVTPPAQTLPPPLLSSRSPSPTSFEAPPEPAKPPVTPQTTAPQPTVASPTPTAAVPATESAVLATPHQTPTTPKQLDISAVRYQYQPPLVFPPASERLGESGVVLLRILVDVQGRPTEVELVQSSGFSRLDQAAMAWIKAARFEPYKEGGTPRAFRVNAPVTYQMLN
jgi:protein TonB